MAGLHSLRAYYSRKTAWMAWEAYFSRKKLAWMAWEAYFWRRRLAWMAWKRISQGRVGLDGLGTYFSRSGSKPSADDGGRVLSQKSLAWMTWDVSLGKTRTWITWNVILRKKKPG